jgi:DNA helicase II / ATP-dependent DNA helicase PcrA
MSFIPSKYQQDIFNFIENGNGNAVINAVAGSGKTTTLIESLKLIEHGKRKLFLAFNKSIKEEIEVKLKKNNLSVDINTCHGFGYSTILKNLEKSPAIDNLKYRKLLRALVNKYQFENEYDISGYNFDKSMNKHIKKFDIEWASLQDKNEFQNRILKIADLCRLFLYNTKAQTKILCSKYSINPVGDEIVMGLTLIELANNHLSTIDYTDMVYLPNIFDMTFEKYDYVFIDECQDLNSAQRELMLKSLDVNGRFIAVGDKKQAIYSFAGADSESFDKLTKIKNTITLPLSECYRCGSDIIDSIKHLVPQIEAHESTGKGVVNRRCELKEIKDGDMVICRNTYPLVKLCLKYLKEGIKATILGGDIGKGLIKMISDTNETDMTNVFSRLYNDLDTLVNRLMTVHNCDRDRAMSKMEYVNALERVQVIEAIFLSSGGDANDVINRLKDIFSDKKEGILLSTIHKSKGLENNRVFIIHNELIPSKYAEQPWELEQENNLRYVAQTRAKSYLGFIIDFDAFSSNDNESYAQRVVPVKRSKHIGKVGDKINILAKLVKVQYMDKFESNVYILEDKDGNVYEKWGKIENRFIRGGILSIGSEVVAKARVSKHTNFGGVNKTVIKNFSHS